MTNHNTYLRAEINALYETLQCQQTAVTSLGTEIKALYETLQYQQTQNNDVCSQQQQQNQKTSGTFYEEETLTAGIR